MTIPSPPSSPLSRSHLSADTCGGPGVGRQASSSGPYTCFTDDEGEGEDVASNGNTAAPPSSVASSVSDASDAPSPSTGTPSSTHTITFPTSALVAARAAHTLPVLGEERSWVPLAGTGELVGAELEAALRHVAVELSLTARKLPRAELLSKVDAFAVVFVGGVVEGAWDELGRTETIRDCHEPRWVAKFRLPGATALDREAPLRIAVYAQTVTAEVGEPGADGEPPALTSAPDLAVHTLLGGVELTLATVLQAPGLCYDTPLRLPAVRGLLGLVTATGPPSWGWGAGAGATSPTGVDGSAGGGSVGGRLRGALTIDADLIRHVHPPSSVTIGFGIDGGEALARNRSQFVLCRALRRGRWAAVYRSEPRVRAEAGAFIPAVLPTDVLCGGEAGRLLRLEVYRYYLNGETALLGFVQVSMEKLRSMREGGELYWWPAVGGITRAKVRMERVQVGEAESQFGMRLTDM